ncbi:hypothetical protein AUJ14_04900 [Candidatus Micrarchaeota archaeon CG1_02_55_22]|nr:MAG: hypothetical protein AUJ14_04900 [Candidatus Micrarchaeota archaeon CG1_02_55_22]
MRNNRHGEFVPSLGHAVHGPAEKFFYSFLQSRGIGFVPAERLFNEDYAGRHVYTVAPWEFHLPGHRSYVPDVVLKTAGRRRGVLHVIEIKTNGPETGSRGSGKDRKYLQVGKLLNNLEELDVSGLDAASANIAAERYVNERLGHADDPLGAANIARAVGSILGLKQLYGNTPVRFHVVSGTAFTRELHPIAGVAGKLKRLVGLNRSLAESELLGMLGLR